MNTDWESVLQFVADPLEHDKQQERTALQVPTPPQSLDGSSAADDHENEQTLVSVSTTFFPGAHHISIPPDIVLLSSDNVFFYVHTHILLAASDNGFRGRIPSQNDAKDQNPIASVPDNSTVLNIILHAVYDMSCAHYSPPFPALISAVNRLPMYGIAPKVKIAPSAPLFSLLLNYAPLFPIELYALAASHDLYDLAVSASSHLLSFPLSTITDEMADKIGPVYLKRLFFLHFGRSDALKRVLLPPPNPHAPTASCDFTEQKKLTRAWALASAYLAWDARPGASSKADTNILVLNSMCARFVNELHGISPTSVSRPFDMRTLPTEPPRSDKESGDAMVARKTNNMIYSLIPKRQYPISKPITLLPAIFIKKTSALPQEYSLAQPNIILSTALFRYLILYQLHKQSHA